MKKRTALFLAIFVLMLVAAAMLIIPGATTPSSDVLDVSGGEGMTFDGLSLYSTAKDNPVTEVPVTYEAWVLLPTGYSEDAGTIYGNYRSSDLGGVRFRLRTDGRPHIYYTEGGETLSVNFYDVNVASGAWTHLTIVDDVETGEMRCYVDGVLVETVEMTDAQKSFKRDVSGMPMCIGGDFIAGTNNFKGNIRSVAVYKDVRTEDEIIADMNSIDLTDADLISAYCLNDMQGKAVLLDATGKYDVINNRMTSDWAYPEELPELEDYAYSMALIGDTQIVAGYYPKEFHHIIDWLLENKETHKIAHVLNMGDMTNFNYDSEWDLVRDQYFRLNGKLDYTLVRGDHDVLDDDVADNGDDTTKYDRWFDVPAYTDRFNNSEDADYYKGENGSITNSYRAIEINGNKYLIVTMDKYPSEDVLAWLDAAIKKYPDHRVIMTMHCFITDNGEYLLGNNNPDKLIGEDIWERIKGYSNLEMVICGHEYAYGVVWTKAEGTNGNVVNQILANPQGPDFDREGATGMIAMLYFSEDGTDVQVRYYSPIIDKYFVGNNNEITGETYRLESSMFKMTTDDMSAATQITELKSVEFEDYIADVTGYVNVYDGIASANVDYYSEKNIRNARLVITYDHTRLSNPVFDWYADVQSKDILLFPGKIIVSWEGLNSGEPESDGYYHSGLFELNFNSTVTDTTPAYINIEVEYIDYFEEGTAYVCSSPSGISLVASVTDEVTVTYGKGDSFEEKLEYAVTLSENGDVYFVMSSDFVAEKDIIIDSSAETLYGMIYVSSADASAPVKIDTNGYNIIFTGNYTFSDLVIAGNASGSKNSLFFPNGSIAVFGSGITAPAPTVESEGGEKVYHTANVTGAYIEINSGEYYYVGGLTDKTLGAIVYDPYIVFQGTAVADCVCGGSRLTGTVVGTAYVYIGGTASVTRYASASGYASYGGHDGQLDVDTTGTIGRLCAAVGPVGHAGYYPTYWMYVSNVKCTTDAGFTGVRNIMKDKPVYVNTVIEINGGEFSKTCYGGLYTGLSYSGVTSYGYNEVTINDGDFTAEVFGGGYLGGANCVVEADSVLNINEVNIPQTVYGGSQIVSAGSVHNGSSCINLYSGSTVKNLYGGSALLSETAGHTGLSEVYISGGTVSGITFGSSYVNAAGATNNGDSVLTIYDGTFGSRVLGGACLAKASTTNYGNSVLNIYGGNTFDYDVIGGVRFDKAGTGYAENGGDGSVSYGNVTVNIYDYDAEGNPAVATFNSGFYGSFFGITAATYAEMVGDTDYEINGAVFKDNASAGPRLQANYQKISGDINGVVNNITAANGFFGGAVVNNKLSVFDSDTCITLDGSEKGYEVSGIVAGGCMINLPNVKLDGDTKLVIEEGVTLKDGATVIGGSYAASGVFSATGAKTEWGMYGSSELVVNGGTVESGALIAGGSHVKGTPASKSVVVWDKYPVVGGVPSENNNNYTRLTINGGTVNGPKIYAGSYLATGGQDHGEVILEMNNGTVVLTAAGIENYTSSTTYDSVEVKTFYPATFYSVDTKEITCDYTLTINGGYFDTADNNVIGLSVFHGYNGTINGDTELNIAISTRAGSANSKYRLSRVVAGINNPQENGVLVGNSTLNVYEYGDSVPDLYPGNPITAGCYGAIDKTDNDENDGIKYGFTQIGDVTLNVSGGTFARTTNVSGFRSNLDGNVTINISGGNITRDIHGAGDSSASYHSSVTGDIKWYISGGVFSKGYSLFGGADAAAKVNCTGGYNVIGGNVFMEITGGTFNGTFHVAGNNSISEGKEARIKFIGGDFVLNTNVLPHGTVLTDYAGTYTIDLLYAEKEVDTTGFASDSIINPFENGMTVTLATTQLDPGTDFSDALETLTWSDKTVKYADLVAFDSYTEFDNALTVYDADTNTAIDVLPSYTKSITLGLEDERSAPISIKNAFRIVAASLSLQENISINFKAEGSLFAEDGLGYTDPYVLVTVNGEETKLDEWTVEAGTGRYVFKFNRIAPNMVGDAVEAVLYATGADGEVYSQTLNYGVKAYCQSQLKKTTIADSFRTVIVDLLNYSAAAQNYTGYKTDDLANAFLQEDAYKSNLAYATTNLDLSAFDGVAKSDYETVENPVVQMHGANLALSDSVTIRYIVSVADVADFEGLKIRISKADGSYTWEFDATDESVVEFYKAQDGRQRYYVRFKGLNATEMSDVIYLKFVDAEGNAVSNTLRYSIGCYAFSKQNDTATPGLAEMVKAMMKYGNAAEAWND